MLHLMGMRDGSRYRLGDELREGFQFEGTFGLNKRILLAQFDMALAYC